MKKLKQFLRGFLCPPLPHCGLKSPVLCLYIHLTIMITIVLLQDGTTALYVASEQGHSTVVQLLAEAGVSLDVQANVCTVGYRRTAHPF